MRRFLVGLIAAAVATIGFGGAGAFASSDHWQLASGSAQESGGVAAFSFAVPDKVRLLFNSKDAAMLGNQSESAMSATFTVADVTGTFTYGGEPSCGGTTGNVRLYFESIPPGTQFAFTNYWWADAASYSLANGTVTISAIVDPTLGQWSDWNGQPSSGNTTAFNAAATNVTAVGLSFGGGCFFENGVGTTDGSGSFTLSDFAS